MIDLPADIHLNDSHWQEYDCPSCGIDFDVSPIPMLGATIRCGCGFEWPAHSGEYNTCVTGDGGAVTYYGSIIEMLKHDQVAKARPAP